MELTETIAVSGGQLGRNLQILIFENHPTKTHVPSTKREPSLVFSSLVGFGWFGSLRNNDKKFSTHTEACDELLLAIRMSCVSPPLIITS